MSCIPFYKLSPSGNMTLLFEGLDHGKNKRMLYATKGLLPCHIGAEQAGFIDISKGKLEMAGGEFCINATRCLALLMALEQADSTTWQGVVHSSGFNQPLHTKVEKISKSPHVNDYDVKLSVPLTSIPYIQELDKGINLVQLPGISHLLIDERSIAFCAKDWQNQAAKLRKHYNLEQELAVGCIWWHHISSNVNSNNEDEQTFFMHPVVVVKEPWAEHYENACGSGALALALWLFSKTKCNSYIMQQPGGNLTINIQEDIQQLKAIVGGKVNLVAQGTAYFD